MQTIEKANALFGKLQQVAKNIPAMGWRNVPGHRRPRKIDADVWAVPADSMKDRKGATKDFRVPLSDKVRLVIELAKPYARTGFLFRNTRGGVIGDMTLSRHMERRGLLARPHGFRSCLCDWLAETTEARHQVAEGMLAHSDDGSTVRA
jgi:integrase